MRAFSPLSPSSSYLRFRAAHEARLSVRGRGRRRGVAHGRSGDAASGSHCSVGRRRPAHMQAARDRLRTLAGHMGGAGANAPPAAPAATAAEGSSYDRCASGILG